MKRQLLVTLTVLSVLFVSGQALAAERSGLSPIEAAVQSSTERGLPDTAREDRAAGTHDVRSYFGPEDYDIHRTIESSKENGGGPATFTERDDQTARSYFSGAENDAPDIRKTIESSTEKGLN